MNVKKLALAFFATMTAGSVVTIAAVSNNSSILTLAEDCEHSGYHYSTKLPTLEEAGTKEYWVCCKCHVHWFAEPDPKGSYHWEEGGTAGAVASSDDRYINALDTIESMTEYLQEEGFKTVTENSDGSYSVKGFVYKGEDLIIIPEGVTSFLGKFTNSVKYVVIPAGCSIPSNAFNNCTTTKAFFVGTTNRVWSIDYYQVQGTGWEYVNGVPTAK